MEYPHVHVDLETYSLEPNGMILSIGAVLLDFKSYSMSDEFHVNIDIEDAEFYPFHVSPDTVAWWKKQPAEARARTFNKETAVPVKVALQQFSDYFKRVTRGQKAEISSCGTDIDIVMLKNAYKVIGLPVPWDWWMVRDMRTLREWVPDVHAKRRKGLHDALEDAKHQGEHLMRIHQFLTGQKMVGSHDL